MDQRVAVVISFIKANLDKKITLNKLAQMVNISTWHLCHVFKANTGMSIVDSVNKFRIEEAKHLLETTFLSIKEIRMKIGVQDESHFISLFEKVYHITPLQYRVRYWKDHPIHSDKPSRFDR